MTFPVVCGYYCLKILEIFHSDCTQFLKGIVHKNKSVFIYSCRSKLV